MGRAVPAVTRALDILELFLEHDVLTIPDIVFRLKLPRTSVHELVNTLLDRGFLTHVGNNMNQFQVGLRAYQVGHHYLERTDLAREGQAVCAAVAAQCQETTHLAVRDVASVAYVTKVDSTHSVRLVSGLGRRLPANCTAVGKMLLSALDDDDVRALFRGALPTLTPHSISDVDDLLRQLAVIRREQVAWEFSESNDAVGCVAAPVYDSSSTLIAAMSVSVPNIRLTEERKPQLAEVIRAAAAELSAKLGAPNSRSDVRKVRRPETTPVPSRPSGS